MDVLIFLSLEPNFDLKFFCGRPLIPVGRMCFLSNKSMWFFQTDLYSCMAKSEGRSLHFSLLMSGGERAGWGDGGGVGGWGVGVVEGVGEDNRNAVLVEMSFLHHSLPLPASADTLNIQSSDMLWFASEGKLLDNRLCLSLGYRFTLIYIIPGYISLSGLQPLNLSLCQL